MAFEKEQGFVSLRGRVILGDSDYFMLVSFKKQDSGKTFDLSRNCLKEF